MSVNRSGNTLHYDLQNYKFIKKHLADSAIVILPISYFSFGLDENRTDRGADNPFVNLYYEYLPKTSIFSYSLKKDLSLKISRIQKNFNKFFSDSKKKKKPAKKKKKVVPTSPEHLISLKKSAVKAVALHKKLGRYSDPEKNINYLIDIIVDAKKSGYHPILVTTPYYKEYTEGYELDWLRENYYQFINSISTKYEITYINYNNNPAFSSDQTLFKNSDHLSSKGRSKFSAIIFKDLVRMGLIMKEDIKTPKKN